MALILLKIISCGLYCLTDKSVCYHDQRSVLFCVYCINTIFLHRFITNTPMADCFSGIHSFLIQIKRLQYQPGEKIVHIQAHCSSIHSLLLFSVLLLAVLTHVSVSLLSTVTVPQDWGAATVVDKRENNLKRTLRESEMSKVFMGAKHKKQLMNIFTR